MNINHTMARLCEKHDWLVPLLVILPCGAILCAMVFAAVIAHGMARATSVQALAQTRGIHLTWWQCVTLSPAEVSYFPSPNIPTGIVEKAP